ncbi:tRNA (adenosine(37)-N6)-dimethylallyltransferase MiaA [Actinomyces sp. zg-332]|uniref:tRNA (adenosine(37)-N6)-dimethylallyltransferase MiaA n=1 Tax=Actinomyces sp. zg-332 TaxID=2708340 RepID=UPI001421F7F7|nr:tRNA (adenosine(37)-N6)-dimethylallyltransferase MiaA [Actinomyces sp. zg-332]QPK93913.1 tRNA (adenosine(37)-N6)-dimethylallyltransferase MiaA [Actinomyces sp. zg-332]
MKTMTIAVVGATGSGKTALSIQMAKTIPNRLGDDVSFAEIISCDAMQLYKGMDIGTAKISPEEMENIPHHMLDCLEIEEEASVAEYKEQTRKIIQDIQYKKGLPIIVGGSGLYLRAVIDKLEFPPTDILVRTKYENLATEKGNEFLYAMLQEKDPLAASNIEEQNTRRIIRALEVIELSGKPFSSTLPTYEYEIPTLQIGVRMPNELLDERLYQRCEVMFESGLVQETEKLLAKGLRQAKTASKATGYAQTIAYLDGEITLKEAIEQTFIATRQLSRRQIKWFRRDKRIQWFDISQMSKEDIVEETIKLYEACKMSK